MHWAANNALVIRPPHHCLSSTTLCGFPQQLHISRGSSHSAEPHFSRRRAQTLDMADSTASVTPTANSMTDASSSNRGRASRGRGGRGGSRGGDRAQNGEDGGNRGNRERGRGGRGGRGRGNRQRGYSQDNSRPAIDGETTPAGEDAATARSNFRARLAGETNKPPADGQKPGEEDDVEAEVCFICASPVVHNSVAPCNHRTCHICSLRLRALYKSKQCAHCRVRMLRPLQPCLR